ncbi:hypothetical protein [Streptomyces sp. NPDC008150]|uniref:hypothetical protein n=1 Tax=Streptomyces sp. NPDC008150 TaxID=3364816 RepID=UPI0036E49BDD
MAIPGNLLSSATESMDPNVAGWTAKTNCTLTRGGGGRNGDGCLNVKATAAGETQTRTVSSYPVTAGTLYLTFADSSSTSAPERIGIRWLNAAGTELSITWSLTTLSALSSWHRVSVAGTAPAGATQAQVILSSTEAAAASHFWENVYLGLPIRTAGNLLPYTTESTEVDTSGWTAGVNTTLSRTVPALTWTVDWYLGGGHMLTATAAAAGALSAVTVEQPTVTPGTEYLAFAYLQPPTLSATTWIELRYYDANGNQIASARGTLAQPATAVYRQRVSAVAPVGAARCAVAVGVDNAAAGQVLRVETVVVLVAPKLQTGSVVTYTDSTFEQGVGSWVVTSGVATLARTTPWGAAAYDGSYALAVTSPTATASTLRSGIYATPGAVGQNWRAQIITRSTAGTWATVAVRIRWYNAAGTDLGASTATPYALPGSGWYALSTDVTAPAGTAQAAVEIVATASATSSVLQVDAVALWQVLPRTQVDAESAGGYITLTLRELPLDDALTVYREAQDGSRSLVRGEDGLISGQTTDTDTITIEDHEAPLNTPVRYYVEMLAPGDTVPATRYSAYVTVILADVNLAWIKDPGNPQRNMQVMVAKAPDWTRPVEQTVYVVRGRRNKVVLSGVRQGLEGDLTLWTRTDQERASLHLLLDSGNTLLWQAAPGMGVDDLYVNVADITEARTGGPAQDLWRVWTLPLVQADMPATVGVNGAAGRTWQDVITEFATWADVMATYATNEDLLLDRRR